MEELLKLRKLHEAYGHDKQVICSCGKVEQTTISRIAGLPAKKIALLQYAPYRTQIIIFGFLTIKNFMKVNEVLPLIKNPITINIIKRLKIEMPFIKKLNIRINFNSNFVENAVIKGTDYGGLFSVIRPYIKNKVMTYYYHKKYRQSLFAVAILKDFATEKMKEQSSNKIKFVNKKEVLKDKNQFFNMVVKSKNIRTKESPIKIKFRELKNKGIKHLLEIWKSDLPLRIKIPIFSYLSLKNPERIARLQKIVKSELLENILKSADKIRGNKVLLCLAFFIDEITINKTSTRIYFSHPSIDMYLEAHITQLLRICHIGWSLNRAIRDSLYPKYSEFHPRATKIEDLIIKPKADENKRFNKLYNLIVKEEL